VLLVLLYLAVMGGIAHRRAVGDYLKETDFYHYYAPDADRLLAGRPPENPFQGPGYPALLTLTYPLSGDHFVSGKWLALAAAGVSVFTAAQLFRTLLGEKTVLPGLLFLVTSADFARFSVQTTTDMPFLALALLAILAAAGGPDHPWARALVAGGLTGLAWLVRYNGLFLVPSCLLGLVTAGPDRGSRPRPALRAAAYLACALAVASPWLVANQRLHGWPVHSLNYLNVAAAAYGFPTDQDGTRHLAAMFRSPGDVLRHDPTRFVSHYVRNLVGTVANTLGVPLAVLPLGLLALAGAVRVTRVGRRTPTIVLPVSSALFVLLMAFTHWESRYFLYVGVCYAGFAAYAVAGASEWVAARWPEAPGRARLAAAGLALAVLVPALVRTPLRVHDMLRREPVELVAASAELRRVVDPAERIMARKPHLPYLIGREWVFLPDVASPEDLRAALCREAVGLFVHDNPTRSMRPGLASLDDRTSGIPWLRRVYESPGADLLVFEVRREGACSTGS
jgi:Dolichyl-phosphate-mannose-protein mannosyltransferase